VLSWSGQSKDWCKPLLINDTNLARGRRAKTLLEKHMWKNT